MVGLSLSLCVSDIARGAVPEGQVEKIVASTKKPLALFPLSLIFPPCRKANFPANAG